MKVHIKKLHKDAVIPQFATKGAACMDLVATDMKVEGDSVVYRFGFATAIPEGYKACFAPRSSFTTKGWVMANSPAQIDSDYRGEWMVKFQAIPEEWKPFHHTMAKRKPPYQVGDRIVQMWLEKVVEFEFEEVDDLSTTDRGEGGFGSTGK